MATAAQRLYVSWPCI